MAVAIHTNRSDKMECVSNDQSPRDHWVYYDSFKACECCYKFRVTFELGHNTHGLWVSGPTNETSEKGREGSLPSNSSSNAEGRDSQSAGHNCSILSTEKGRDGLCVGAKRGKTTMGRK